MNNYFDNLLIILTAERDREKFYDTPASVYNIKKRFQDHQSFLKIKSLWCD